MGVRPGLSRLPISSDLIYLLEEHRAKKRVTAARPHFDLGRTTHTESIDGNTDTHTT